MRRWRCPEDPRPARAQVTSYEVSANVPIPLGKKTFLVPGAVYHVEAVSYGIPGGGQSIPDVLFFRAGATWRIPRS